ncbi:unnamed protein product [Closterium sp. Yama58-4]|nr:unnamed protein product [Closterium sp. Yama58-4]
MKQALVEGADRLNGPHMFEQGSGQLNLLRSHAILASYTPRASVHPASLDLTDCPYSWPWCCQPLFASSLPLIINATVLNGMGVTGWLAAPPVWVPTEVNLTSTATDGGSAADGGSVNMSTANSSSASSSSASPPPHRVLHVRFSYPAVLWPWSGNLGIYLRVHPAARHLNAWEYTWLRVHPGARHLNAWEYTWLRVHPGARHLNAWEYTWLRVHPGARHLNAWEYTWLRVHPGARHLNAWEYTWLRVHPGARHLNAWEYTWLRVHPGARHLNAWEYTWLRVHPGARHLNAWEYTWLRVHPGARHLNAWEYTWLRVHPGARHLNATHRTTNCSLPLRVAIMPTPARHRRVLWDQFHNVRYPPGYIPRDSLDVRNDTGTTLFLLLLSASLPLLCLSPPPLPYRDSLDVRNDILDWHGDHPHTNFHGLFSALREWGFTLEVLRDSLDVRNDILDWHGDHPHTNFHGLFAALREWGFTLEVLGSPLTCFDVREYGALLMVDMEEEYHADEIAKLHHDVTALGLGLIVVGDWYHVPTMKHMRFFDDNTRSWWTPATDGAPLHALSPHPHATMKHMRFFDDNTRSWWTPATGGANVPALNDLLSPFGIAFGDAIHSGTFPVLARHVTLKF